jgi:branched-chain amino acid transport system substrate-binding protein
MRRLRTLLFAMAVVAAAEPISYAWSDEKPIIIGFAVAKSGWMEPYDTGPSRFAELAIAELNAKGGLLGRKIVSIYADTKTDVNQSAKAGQELIDKGADLLILSCDYDMGAPAAAASEQAGVVAFSTCAGDPLMGVQGVGPHTFTAAQAAQVQGAVLADWAFAQKNYRDAYVLLDTFIEFNKSVCAGFDYAWDRHKNEGAQVVGRDTFNFNDPSVASQITRIKSLDKQPDFIVICSFPPGGASAIRQMRAAGITTPIATGEGFDGAFWLNAVPDLGEFYTQGAGSVYGNDPREKVNQLVKDFTDKYGSPPVSAQSLEGYPVIEMWAKAVERAKTTKGDAVIAELEKFRDEPTAIGPRTYTQNLHITNKGTFLMMQVTDGKHVPLGLYANNEPIPMDVLFRTKSK